jgi:hypothetical protein
MKLYAGIAIIFIFILCDFTIHLNNNIMSEKNICLVRRTKYGFRESKSLDEKQKIEKLKWGYSQLDIVKRYAIIGSLFPEEQSVLVPSKIL